MEPSDFEKQYAPLFAFVGIEAVRAGLVLIYLWFGLAKLFSPADGLELVTGLLDIFDLPSILATGLAVWEVIIGLLYLRPSLVRYAALNTVGHLLGTFLPLLLLPALTVVEAPWLTLHGQFIVKNLALLGGAALVWAFTIRRAMHNEDP